MRRTKLNNQKGFGLWELLLLILLILFIILIGWYVWQSQQKANKAYDDASQSQSEPAKAEKKKEEPAKKAAVVEVDPTKDWKTFSSAAGVYSFKYPPTWVVASNLETCNPGLALLGGNAASTGKCATESFGQMSFTSAAGNQLAEYEMQAANYTELTSEAATVSGVVGKKQTGTYKQVGEDIGPGPQTGDKYVKYTFFTNNRTYSATYAIQAAYPDVLSDFNLLMTKTFKFQP